MVDLDGDDRLTIVHPDGGGIAELSVFSAEGDDALSVLGGRSDRPASVIRGLAADGDLAAVELSARGINPTEAVALALFGETARPGSSVTFRSERPVLCAIANPLGGSILIEDDAMPASDMLIEIKRTIARRHDEIELPAPLAEPRLDFRIDKATARSYEVKAGEYIQVIDVEGRQCSDFLAFHRRRLEDGVERGLDSTVTHTLMGQAYPQPGLHGKFYDADMNPLVEVVRDTVGRHDTFALACTTKYYEDMGYFGHVSCSENFNRQIAEYGIAARKGWPALNIFYNTMFGSDNILVFDEPWSRPGDYVLLRAMTDLVCASSSCPDDIDPANGWDPTDVHVRVYTAEHKFSVAIAHRVTPEATPRLTKETGFHPKTSALTNRFTEYNGYWLPTSFDNEGAIAEYWACRERAVVMDLSALRKWEVVGPDAEALLQWVMTRDIGKLSTGQVVYTALCYPTGGMVDDATIFRLGRDNFRVVGGSEYDGVWMRRQSSELGLDRVWIKDSTDSLSNVAVQGPQSRELLTGLFWTSPAQTAFDRLTWFRFAVARLGGPQGTPLLVSRTGYTGELGYEIFCHPKDAEEIWDAIWEAGRPYRLTPLGLDALDMVRVEAGLVFPGIDFDDQTDPFEAGLGFTVPAGKEVDFSGKRALQERRANPQRKLVGLDLAGNEPAGHGDSAYSGRMQIGVVTSGVRSPLLQKNLAFCRIHVDYAEPGTAVEIGKLDGQQKRIPATVVAFPFYDPEKTRPRS